MDGMTDAAVVLTREPDDNRELAAKLGRRGVRVVEIPCVATRYLVPDALPSGPVDAVTFSSRRGVEGFVRAGLDDRLLPAASRALVGAVGDATAAALASAGIDAHLVADPPEGRVLAGLLLSRLAPASRVAVVRGNLRAGGMDRVLEEAGHRLEPVEVYQNIAPDIPRLDRFAVAAVFVASPSAAERLLEKNPWFGQHHFCAIGPTTAAALGRLGVASVEMIGAKPEDWITALSAAARAPAAREET